MHDLLVTWMQDSERSVCSNKHQKRHSQNQKVAVLMSLVRNFNIVLMSTIQRSTRREHLRKILEMLFPPFKDVRLSGKNAVRCGRVL